MKQKTVRNKSAFTLLEMCVVIAVLALLVAMLLPALSRAKIGPGYRNCVNNLKEIGIAYRLWPSDQGDLAPSQTRLAYGGWQDLLTNADQGAICWTNYAIMRNDLAQSTRVVICPSDERSAATSFTNGFDNSHLSYFVGVGANDAYPRSILGGDRNLGPGATPDPICGFSPANGQGNDVALRLTGSVSWSLKMHSAGDFAGAGNILLGDGSVQSTTTATLNEKWLPNAQDSGNWPSNHIPVSPSIRLVFP